MKVNLSPRLLGGLGALVMLGSVAATGATVAHAAAGQPIVSLIGGGPFNTEGDQPVTINGANFWNGGSASAVTAVQFGDSRFIVTTTPCPTTPPPDKGCFNPASSDGVMTGFTPSHPQNSANVDVLVTTAGGTSTANGAGDLINFVAATPVQASLSQHSGAPGTTITVSPATGSQESSAYDWPTKATFTPASGPALVVDLAASNVATDLIKMQVPSSGMTFNVPYDVTITTTGGKTSPVNPATDQFTFVAPVFHPTGVGAPQVAVTPDGSTQLVFWKSTTTNQLTEAWYTGVWNGPMGFPQLGTLTSTPAVAVTKDGSTQLVFWQGPGGHLFEAWYTGVWNGPLDITNTYLGGHAILASAPSVVTTKDGSQLVFWRGTDGHLGEAWYSSGWHGPVDFTTLGSMASAPSATVTADGSTQLVFFQGTNNLLTEDWFTGVWNGPMTLGALTSPPSVAVTPDGSTQLVFYKGSTGHLLESWYTGHWNGPVDFTNAAFGGQGLLTSSPSATVTVDGSTQLVFWQGAGNTLWEGWYAGGAWHGPVNWSA